MATVSNPLIGSTSGSVGGVTFSKWKGINVIKSKPTVVANPNTVKQQAQRASFSFMVAVYRLMVGILVLGFKELAIKKSAFNAFVSTNIKAAFDVSLPPASTFIPENFKISKGTMSDTAIAAVVVDEDTHNLTLSYSDQANLPGQSLSDLPLMAAFNADNGEWASGIGEGSRQSGNAGIAIPLGWLEADEIHCYLGFVNVSGDSASDSAYMAAPVV